MTRPTDARLREIASGALAVRSPLTLTYAEQQAVCVEVIETRRQPMSETETDTVFRMELQSLLNSNCKENGSNTPDFILANFLCDCLRAFDLAANQREHWYGLKMRPGEEPLRVGERDR